MTTMTNQTKTKTKKTPGKYTPSPISEESFLVRLSPLRWLCTSNSTDLDDSCHHVGFSLGENSLTSHIFEVVTNNLKSSDMIRLGGASMEMWNIAQLYNPPELPDLSNYRDEYECDDGYDRWDELYNDDHLDDWDSIGYDSF